MCMCVVFEFLLIMITFLCSCNSDSELETTGKAVEMSITKKHSSTLSSKATCTKQGKKGVC